MINPQSFKTIFDFSAFAGGGGNRDIHTFGMNIVLNRVREKKRRIKESKRVVQAKTYWIGGVILLMFLVSVVEVLAWALLYIKLNAIEGFEQAFYFSMVTFTTLGYGDVLLMEPWRILASFEAGIGIIMFGWTSAIVISVVQQLYLDRE